VGPGDVLGAEPPTPRPVLAPVLTYRVEPGDVDVHAVYQALRELADEDPLLGVRWDEQLGELHVRLMGAVQREVVEARLAERLGAPVGFGPGSILYQETITAPVMGYGHFEPLRHYAEAHLRLEPLPAGSGVVYGTVCSTDDLDLNWQRLILSCAMEREHRGVLAGYPLTDVRITLVSGRAHPKHTEGGDFRQAAWRAIRQGLMTAREQGAERLLEPWYRLTLEVPADKVGRALADLQRMQARFGAPEVRGARAVLSGEVPASEVGDYALEVAAYTSGEGSLALEFSGYEPCHDAARVVDEAAYEPEADLPHTPDSVFCAHGAGYTVKWHEAAAAMHVTDDEARQRPWRAADASFFSRS
jgi:translation elongation factor EF-G